MRGNGGNRRKRGDNRKDSRYFLNCICFCICICICICILQEEEKIQEEERKANLSRQQSEFVKNVRTTGGGMIGLVNNTGREITFTSLRLLMERSQVVRMCKFPFCICIFCISFCICICICVCISF